MSRQLISIYNWRWNLVCSRVMPEKALGLIETKGLIGAIAAADAAAKAAAVVISSVELTDAAFMTLKIEGDLGAVQAAVMAAAAEAEKVGELIAAHVIPRPDSGLAPILPPLRYISKYHPEEKRPPLDDSDSEPDLPSSSRNLNFKTTARREQQRTEPKESFGQDTAELSDRSLEGMTVGELRQIARGLEGLPLKGREISMANKQQLIDAIRSVRDRK